MLHIESVEPSTLELLRRIQALPALSETRLVGGTALALQLGHRVSVDLDIFGHWDLNRNLEAEFSKVGPTEKHSGARMLVPFDWEAAKDEIRAAVRSLLV